MFGRLLMVGGSDCELLVLGLAEICGVVGGRRESAVLVEVAEDCSGVRAGRIRKTAGEVGGASAHRRANGHALNASDPWIHLRRRQLPKTHCFTKAISAWPEESTSAWTAAKTACAGAES